MTVMKYYPVTSFNVILIITIVVNLVKLTTIESASPENLKSNNNKPIKIRNIQEINILKKYANNVYLNCPIASYNKMNTFQQLKKKKVVSKRDNHIPNNNFNPNLNNDLGGGGNMNQNQNQNFQPFPNNNINNNNNFMNNNNNNFQPLNEFQPISGNDNFRPNPVNFDSNQRPTMNPYHQSNGHGQIQSNNIPNYIPDNTVYNNNNYQIPSYSTRPPPPYGGDYITQSPSQYNPQTNGPYGPVQSHQIYWLNEKDTCTSNDNDLVVSPENIISVGQGKVPLNTEYTYLSCGYLINGVYCRIKLWHLLFVGKKKEKVQILLFKL
jgi:hypothetical protein